MAAVLPGQLVGEVMKYQQLRLHNGVLMPVLGFGCGGLLDMAAVQRAVHLGYPLFDTAQAQEANYFEEHLGNALLSTQNRTSVFITSKLSPRHLGEKQTLEAFPLSLRQLHTTYLDAFLLHAPRCWNCATAPNGTWAQSWAALEQLYESRAVRALGVSNFSPEVNSYLLLTTHFRDSLTRGRQS